MIRQPVTIAVHAGIFESQPLVFAHLYDLSAGALALDEVEVICKENPGPRLAHYFAPKTAAAITEALGLHTTVVLLFPEAMEGDLESSTMLTPLGRFEGTRVKA
ncbi:MAG: hypothetical protein MK180_13660 [Rhodobacteraceae bacterium]|nr:hypothetical protein [Paracoccaceae bacterium]